MKNGAHMSETQPSALSPSGHAGTLSRDDKQDTPWINVFSVVSRPALSLLQKYLPGLLQTRSLTDSIPEWVSEDLTPTLSSKEVAYLGDIMPLTERSQHVGRLIEPRSESNFKWLTAESLSELGIKHPSDIEKQPIMGDFSSARNLGHVLLNATSSTEATSSLLKVECRSHTWWGGFWGSEDGSQSWLSKLSLGKGERMRGAHISPPLGGTKAAVAQTTALIVQFSSWESMASENAGHSSNTQQPVNNGSLESPQPESPKCSDGLVLQQEPCTNGPMAGAATVFSEVAVLTPDQDNGYSSLEEGHVLCQPYMVKVIPKEEFQVAGDFAAVETETSEPTEEPSPAAKGMEEDGAEDACDVGGSEESGGGETSTQEGSSAAPVMLTSPYCQNRAIAFIMGSPCSDDDDDDDDDDADNLSDSEFSDCDDGFDSECSSEISDSDSDDSDSDHEVDWEAERLLNSLCPTQDPYNPRNFTAPMNTGPRPIPSTSAAAARSSDSSPDSSPDQGSAPLASPSLSVSPPGLQHPDSWDDSTSASEAEDADSLFNSFSCSSDPYNPLNFQAAVWTERPLTEVQEEQGCQGKNKSLKMPPRSTHQAAAAAAASSPPRYMREEAEDRLDSGFSEPPAHASATSVTSQSCVVFKKVRFCEEVEEFFTSSREDEDRRGQWEELARDRCRFSRRCRDVELSIAYCLEPQHRTLVYQRITVSCES